MQGKEKPCMQTSTTKHIFSYLRANAFACRQLSAGLSTIVSKPADNCEQACRRLSAGNYSPEKIRIHAKQNGMRPRKNCRKVELFGQIDIFLKAEG